MKLQSLPQKAIDVLTDRIGDEQAAYYFYISASAWCRLNGYENASKFFQVESHGEEYHYKRIVGFLADWNINPKFPKIEAPIQDFDSLKQILEEMYKMELKLYDIYERDTKNIFDISQNTYNFLQQFVNIQNDSVVETGRLITKMEKYLPEDPTLTLFDRDAFEQYQNYY